MSEYTLNGCNYVVRRETVIDAMRADALARTFPSETLWEFARTFSRYAILTTVDGKPVLGKPIEQFTNAELHAAAEAWGESDPEAVYLFYEAVMNARQTPNAEHLKPGVEPGNSPALNEPNS